MEVYGNYRVKIYTTNYAPPTISLIALKIQKKKIVLTAGLLSLFICSADKKAAACCEGYRFGV